ncbi:inositol 2-dehydrogenase [Saccharospirillum salsuginis]|uniref:Inositol 2-dehydrogenase n=1 Tax=Saccharospirillum salsuginis TaxID=418750 RepID=A0A918NDS5_9GAMM|nr:inositol 2-dehydrogenase [Saccharospirillum salsuginis]GGX65054.1 inositol 2-dehydrogenase [Saccharospirillum salsuginis]
MINLCLFGAGRIGAIHAANVAANPDARLTYVVDVFEASAHKLADQYDARVVSVEQALADPEVHAVIIASSTDTHADLIERSAEAGKAIFCEKPIDLDLDRTRQCLATIERCGVACLVGFNRRYDPQFNQLKSEIDIDRIGSVEMVTITSRDPSPPPAQYVQSSGGLFRDMMIHDLDMARWLLGEEPVEVFATASCLIDPAIGQAGDVDTALVTLKTASGKLCQISNSRRAVYGYDQRIEVLGAKGMLQANNQLESNLVLTNDQGASGAKPQHFFLERYAEAYRLELTNFIEVLTGQGQPLTNQQDGLMALALAEAALESARSGRAVTL